MNEEHNLTEEKQFLQEFAAECNFYGDTLEIFLKRFEPSKASLTDEMLAQYIEWGKKLEDGKQKILDELRKNIYPVLKKNGCPLPDSQRGRQRKGENPKEIVLAWLWQTKFYEWKSQKNQTPVSSIPDINWHQVCESRLDAYKQRFLTNPLTVGNSLDFYVPLGLVEPKREQQKRQKDEVNPEKGSRFYQLPETEITKTYTEPNQFFEEVLRQGNSKTKGQRLAIIGEPGAGKTTLLYQISRWILQENLGYPILIRLAEVNQPLRQFLTQNWLREAEGSPTEVSPEWVSSFKKFITGGKVWLLLDAVDEMGITSPLTNINQQLAEGWMHGLRVVLTCRLNLWETEQNALRDFDVYRNLDFNSQQIQEFIEQWFNDKTKSQELLKQLKEPNQNRVNDLIKNPLRLALLCRTWKRGEKLPETQAGLYKRLVNRHYQWKDEQKPFQIPLDVQECLHEKLGELAKDAINREQFRFRLEEKFVEQYLGNPQRENTLFDWALKLGWLNRVGLASVEEKDSDQAVYAFFHPTFQEYFAALAIKDWDYFLPRNHGNCPVEGKEYRIFQPQWKQVILLWLGRDDVEVGEKEAFIRKLVNFDDGYGEWSFYRYRAFFLAAAGINEFKECSLSDAIVEQIVKWKFGYFDIEKQQWVIFLDPIEEGAKTVLPETIRKNAINHLIQVLETTKNEYTLTLRRVADNLGEIAVGNELAIRALIRVLEMNKDEWTRQEVADNLGKIAVGNELAIRALIRVLETTNNKYTRRRVADNLGKIAVGNELAIRELIRVLETTKTKYTLRRVADILGKIAVGNELAIRELRRVSEMNKDEWTRQEVADILGKIAVGNELAIGELSRVEDEDILWSVADNLGESAVGNELVIAELIRVLETTNNEDTRRSVADSLGKIAVGNELAIGELIRVLEMNKDEDTRWWVVEILGQIAPRDKLAIGALIRVLETTEDEDTRRSVADSLGKIAVGNELAIMALIRVLGTTEDEDTLRSVADSLGKIAVGNELAIMALIRVLGTTKNEDTRREVADSLGRIIKTKKQYADVVFALNHNLTNEVYKNNFYLYINCYDLLWQCAQNLPYPKFYQAWHHNTLTPHPEIIDNTPVGNTPTVRQLEQQITNLCTQLPYPHLHCIDAKKLQNLNSESKFVQGFCNRLYQKLLPNETIPKMQTVTDLETEIINLKQQLQTPYLFILLQGDGTPTPEVIDYCDYLTDELNLAWVTPEPLPRLSSQRSFISSQENLLDAVKSWVEENQ